MEVDKYIDYHKKEAKKEEKETDELFERLNRKARLVAKKLGNKYNLEKVYLFGSILNIDKFSLNSDVDFAVKNLSSEQYLDAFGDLEKKLNHNFDLVQIERANEALLEIIKDEGEIIYDSTEKKWK